MPILIDFNCRECGSRGEQWTPSPPPTSVWCTTCGGQARRVWAPVGLRESDSTNVSPPYGHPAPSETGGQLCQQYPQIPGLCHMTPSAQRRWVAAYTRDNLTFEQELARQEKAADVKAPTMADAIGYHHRT